MRWFERSTAAVEEATARRGGGGGRKARSSRSGREQIRGGRSRGTVAAEAERKTILWRRSDKR